MLPMGSWFIATLIQDKADGKIDFNWGVTKIPHPEGVEAGSTVGSVTPIAINAKTALEVKSLVLDRPLDAKMAAVRKVIEEEHDMIMIGEEDIETGIANMNERAAEAREE